MRALDHFQEYKDSIKTLGRELDSYLTVNGSTIDSENVYSVSVSFEGTLMKSIMKKMVIETSDKFDIGSIVTIYLKVGNSSIGFNGEYINYYNYIVKEEEYREDSKHYIYTCYDGMLKTMKDYDYREYNYHFPMTIRQYMMDLCVNVGMGYSDSIRTGSFANADRILERDQFKSVEGDSLGYTYRDVFDQLAEVTGSILYINNDGNLELKYLVDTEDTIDEDFFKDVNVSFKEKYGPVNSVVLSRVGADNIYQRDETSIAQNGLCEIKIVDNQIMSGDDRGDYLPELFAKLNGTEYYLNDFASTGITYYDPGDIYTISIGENSYKCAMLNDEINITAGLSENIYTEMPEQGETDYTKADKVDRKINQTYIKVDKVENEIEALSEQIIPVSSEAIGTGSITLENAYKGTLHRLEIIGSIQMVKPKNTLRPSDELVPTTVLLHVDSNIYDLGSFELNYYNNNAYDKFVYEDGKCWIERYSGHETEYLDDVIIEVDSNSTIYVENHLSLQLRAEYLLDNEYTDSFAPTVDLIAKINLSPGKAEIDANKISLAGKEIDLTADNISIMSENFKVDSEGNLICNNAEVNGGNIHLYSDSINPRFVIEREGGSKVEINGGFFRIMSPEGSTYFNITPIALTYRRIYSNEKTTLASDGLYGYLGSLPSYILDEAYGYGKLELYDELGEKTIDLSGNNGHIECVSLTQTSLKEKKKNFERLENAKKILEDVDIYKYNLKDEEDGDKKHIGFIIGEDYKYSKDITSANNDGVDIYSMVSVLWKVVQEQQEEIKELRKMIEKDVK